MLGARLVGGCYLGRQARVVCRVRNFSRKEPPVKGQGPKTTEAGMQNFVSIQLTVSYDKDDVNVQVISMLLPLCDLSIFLAVQPRHIKYNTEPVLDNSAQQSKTTSRHENYKSQFKDKQTS